MRSRREQRGFTLVEIMVVVIIIGVLAAIVLPRLMVAGERGKRAAALAQIKNFVGAIYMFKMDGGRYPTTSEGLAALLNKPADFKGDFPKGGYLDAEAIPKDPWGNEYVYACPGTGNKDFDIISYGSDGKPGGESDAADITN